MAPRIDQVNLVVRDLAASAAFYRELGVDLPESGTAWDRHHRNGTAGDGPAVDLDSPAFASRWCAGWPSDATGVVVDFRVDERAEVDARHDRLVARGGTSLQQPWDAFWGARFAAVADPDGNVIGIMSEIDPAMRGEPIDPPD